MQLSISVQTDKPDLFIDYIQATLKTGEEIALTWDKSYIERTENGFLAQYVAVQYFDEETDECIYLHSDDIAGITIEDFGTYTDMRGPTYFKVDEMVFDEEGMEYILDPSLYLKGNHDLEQNHSIYFIDGKAYGIEKSLDTRIEREKTSGEKELCEGYYCQLYHASDKEHLNELDNFTLAVGYEIADLSEESFDIGLRNYLDNKSIWICVYKNTLEHNDDLDNLTYIRLPRLWLFQTMKEEGILDNALWFNEYTADNTEYIARKAFEDGIIIECEDKNIDINLNNRKVSLDNKLLDAAQKRANIYPAGDKEKENLQL